MNGISLSGVRPNKRRRRVYWVLVGPRAIASSRLHGYLIHEYCREHGYDSVVLYHPPARVSRLPLKGKHFGNRSIFHTDDVVVFQKLRGPDVVSATEFLRNLGVRTIYIDSDYPPKLQEASNCCLTVCASDELAGFYRAQRIGNVVVLPEAYESSSRAKPAQRVAKPVTCVWFGSTDPQKLAEVEWFRELLLCRFPHYRLLTVSDSPQHDVNWDLDTCWDTIADCDIAVIPGSDTLSSLCKSPNRVVQAMAIGLPVVAFPIPSYKKLIKHGKNGYLCRGDEEWTTALLELGSSAVRARIGQLGYRFARRYFNIHSVGPVWTRALYEESPEDRSLNDCSDSLGDRLALAILRSRAYFGIANRIREASLSQKAVILQATRRAFQSLLKW